MASRRLRNFLAQQDMDDNTRLRELDELIDGQLHEFADNDDRISRVVIGSPTMAAMKAPKGKKLKAYGTMYKHGLKETGKGAAKGAAVGAGLGAAVLGAMSIKKRGLGKTMRRLRKSGVASRAGKAGLIGGVAGLYGGTIAGGIKGNSGKEATRKYREVTQAD